MNTILTMTANQQSFGIKLITNSPMNIFFNIWLSMN